SLPPSNNLFETVPWLRQFLRDIDWPHGLNNGFTRYIFPIYLAGLFLGPQDRDHNVLLQLFWSWWWPAIMVIYPVLGRIWCSVCPFMIYGEWAQETLKKVFPTFKLKKWPQFITQKWGPWFLYGLFVAILYWEELWDLPQNAALSAWLLLLITGGAVVTSLQYEKRLWCASLCPIGGMNGMFAKLSLLSVRTEPGLCQSCGQYLCINNEKNNKPGMPVYILESRFSFGRRDTGLWMLPSMYMYSWIRCLPGDSLSLLPREKREGRRK
ncbi:nitrogen assimilation regulatory protein, partial [Nannochloropsis gaditana]